MTVQTKQNTTNLGVHFICEFWDCDPKVLNDEKTLLRIIKQAVTYSQATLLAINSHRFTPYGVTVVALLSESHMSIHTWPELGYAAVDAFTCGTRMQPEKAVDVFEKGLRAGRIQIEKILRGTENSMIREKAEERKSFWFTEISNTAPSYDEGLRSQVFTTELLHEANSAYQRIQVLDTLTFGKALVIDDIIQTTEVDEYIYHEMLALLPCIVRKNPKKALIIGGGDGGSLREIVRIKSIKEALMVEIDEDVVTASREFLPTLSHGAFDDKKTTLIIGDGMEWTRKYDNYFDVIVLDLTDPLADSPAEKLFKLTFFADIKRALTTDGIFSVQSGSATFQIAWVKKLFQNLKSVFSHVELRLAHVPAYQAGEYSFIIASQKPFPKDVETITDHFSNIKGETKYLSPEMYFASAVLPPMMKKDFQ